MVASRSLREFVEKKVLSFFLAVLWLLSVPWTSSSFEVFLKLTFGILRFRIFYFSIFKDFRPLVLPDFWIFAI